MEQENKEIKEIKETKEVMTEEIINNMNKKTMKLFEDSDFRHLLSIYMKKPELFSILFQYIQNGTMTPIEDSEIKSIPNEEELINEIKQLGFKVSDDIIRKKLIKFSGHLNLTVRSLLQDSVS